MGRVGSLQEKRSPLELIRFNQLIEKHDDGSEKELYALSDHRGYFFSKEDVMAILEKTIEFYNCEDQEEFIKKENRKLRFYAHFKQNEDGKFIIPGPEFTRKLFKLDRHWSCKCGWCGNRASSKEQEAYYTVYEQRFKIDERACSEACAIHIWKDGVKTWIHDHEYDDLFEMEEK